ncbi:hypothetical protein BABINDRAFT_159201 [Babjeviella inositovora NRRL Y-12698]|uniref:Uncharacterized protein n=1 Tax=Babjeviella inositovora NRRL Y-12698 TaxID=984486 RepID=A0A1E3QYI1_9ASCO|nr:uncharacterized protein BABINDRAFT_159201 [Babjeviella inositovora NRRL Y-12698]ODQ82671.1 hypothetical protein BABINDRAFT_159201 [Babjeviella inositovora NRRL Y-12698]
MHYHKYVNGRHPDIYAVRYYFHLTTDLCLKWKAIIGESPLYMRNLLCLIYDPQMRLIRL